MIFMKIVAKRHIIRKIIFIEAILEIPRFAVHLGNT